MMQEEGKNTNCTTLIKETKFVIKNHPETQRTPWTNYEN